MKTFQLLFSVLILSFSLNAQDPILDSAKTQYDQANYVEAIESYETVLSQGLESGELRFNLGNAYYRTGNTGKAILNYEKALLELPGDEDVLFNLAIANSQKKDVFEDIPNIGFGSIFTSINKIIHFEVWAILSCILFLLTGGLYFYAKKEKVLKYKRLSFVAAITAIILGTVSVQQKNAVLNSKAGIIINKQSNIFSEPNINSTLLLEVNKGTKLKILNEDSEWFQIQSPSNDKGWIQKENIESI